MVRAPDKGCGGWLMGHGQGVRVVLEERSLCFHYCPPSSPCSYWTSWMSWMILCWATCPQQSSLFYTHTCSPVLWTTGTQAGGLGIEGQRPASDVRSLLHSKSAPQAPLPPCASPHHGRDLHRLQQHCHGHFYLPAQVCRLTQTWSIPHLAGLRPTSCCLSTQGLLGPSVFGVMVSHILTCPQECELSPLPPKMRLEPGVMGL